MPGPRKPLTAAGWFHRYRAAVERNAPLLERAMLRRTAEQLLVEEQKQRRLRLVR